AEDLAIEFSALLTEGQASQFFLDSLPVCRISRRSKVINETEEMPLLLLLGRQTSLHEVGNNAARGDVASLSDPFDLFGHRSRQRNALPQGFIQCRHELMLHHFAPHCTCGLCVR